VRLASKLKPTVKVFKLLNQMW